MDYVPPGELKAVDSLYKMTTQGYVVGGYDYVGPYRDLRYRQFYVYLPFSEWRGETVSVASTESGRVDWPIFVVISYGTTEFYDYRLGEPEFIITTRERLTSSAHYNRIYMNPDFDLYLQQD
jgi:hypothetical protein